MRLLDKPLTRKEKSQALDMLQGNIARISVSDDIVEITAQLGFAVDQLNILAYSRIMELSQNSLKNDD